MSESWRQPLLGLSSKDFENRQSIANPNALYGASWRYAHDQDFNRKLNSPEEPAKAPDNMKSPDKLPPVSDEPQGIVTPKEQAPKETANTMQTPPANDSKAVDDDAPVTREQLMTLPKERLIEIASGVGVVNLQLGRQKLIDAILEKSA